MTKIPGGWQYVDGTVAPTLNELRDALMGRARAEADSGRLAAALTEGKR